MEIYLHPIYIIKYINSTSKFKKNITTTSTSLNRSHFITIRRRFIQNYTFGVPVVKITILLCYYYKSIKLIYIRLFKKKLKPFLFNGQPFNSKVIMSNYMFMNIIQISEILNSIVLQ